MTAEEVLKGNKLIAEFMGKPTGIGISIGTFNYYHFSWSQLMPVVEKLCKTELTYANVDEKYTKYPRTFGMLDDEGNFMVRLNCASVFHASTLIEATWLAVVDYIKNDI